MQVIALFLMRLIALHILVCLINEIKPFHGSGQGSEQDRSLYTNLKDLAVSCAVQAPLIFAIWKLGVSTAADIFASIFGISRRVSTHGTYERTLAIEFIKSALRLLTVRLLWVLTLDHEFGVVGYDPHAYPYGPRRFLVPPAAYDRVCMIGTVLGTLFTFNAWWIFPRLLEWLRSTMATRRTEISGTVRGKTQPDGNECRADKAHDATESPENDASGEEADQKLKPVLYEGNTGPSRAVRTTAGPIDRSMTDERKSEYPRNLRLLESLRQVGLLTDQSGEWEM